jgi:hypothetical protein
MSRLVVPVTEVERYAPAYLVTFRGLPDLAGRKFPSSDLGYSPRFGERNALVMFACADAAVETDTFGLGAVLYVAGPSIVSGAILTADDLAKRAPKRLAAIGGFAASTPISSRPGAPSFEVLTLSRFFDPCALAGDGLRFAPTAYTGAAFTVGVDLGRFWGLVAEHCATTEGARGWSIFPPGWWKPAVGKGKWHRASPNRPELQLSSRRDGWQLGWARTGIDPTGRPYGKRRPGAFIDVLSLAYALDADRGASFSEHRENLGLAPVEPPLRVPVDDAGAAQVLEAVQALHETALALDHRAAQWFTTSEERAEGRGKLHLARISSPGAVAADIPRRFRVTPPLDKFALDAGEIAAWFETFSGGRCWLDQRFAGLPFPCVLTDVSSAFPAAAVSLAWWDLLTAERIEIEDVTEDLRALRERAAIDPRAALDPAVWRRLGFTIATERLLGEPRHVEIEEAGRPDGRTETVPVFSPERPLHAAWPDSVAGAVLAGGTDGAEVLAACRLVPVGRQPGLRHKLPILPGLVCDVGDDPAVALVRHRRAVKGTDPVLGGELHAVVNSLVSGILSRVDPLPDGGEVAGPWCFVPIASTVQAGARLYLAAFERLVRDRGGCPVYCDTDSWLVVASPDGGDFGLPDGTSVDALSWPEVDEITAAFDGMRPFGPDIPPWKVDRGTRERPLHSVVYGPKRHAEFTLGGEGEPEIVERTDANLGGFYADPPALAGRDSDGLRRWSREALGRQVAFDLDRERGWPEAPWDTGRERPALAVRRLEVRSPEVLKSLPAALGARPGSPYVETIAGTVAGVQLSSDAGAVALDTGAPDPWQLDWLDRASGRPVRLGTSPAEIDRRLVATLDEKALAWALPAKSSSIEAVHVDRLLVQHRGRVSGIIDADIDGLPGDRARFRPVYDPAGDADRRLAFVQKRAKALGKRAFARRTGLPLKVAERAALGQPIADRNVRRALKALRFVDASTPRCPECGRPVLGRRGGSIYCSERHRGRAAKRRRVERLATDPGARIREHSG